MTLPRCYLSGARDEARRYRLYGFCDASTAAYAAVVYLVEADDHKYSSFVVSKTRVLPLKAQTIPRLELLSMLLLARLVYSVTEALITRLNMEEPRCFTDSQVALFWIKGTGRDWKLFVQNRVDEIRKVGSSELLQSLFWQGKSCRYPIERDDIIICLEIIVGH